MSQQIPVTPEPSAVHKVAARISGAKRTKGGDKKGPTDFFTEAVTEDRIAKLFTFHHGKDWRFVQQWGRWLFWTGKYWRWDETSSIENVIRQVCREAALCTDKLTQLPRIESATTVKNVDRLLRADPVHATSSDAWDKDIWLLNTPSGTYDLRSGKCLGHSRDHFITRITRVDPHGQCEGWNGFLNTVTGGDPELAGFLQHMIGYCLTGSTQEQALFFLFGTGGNGKSLFIEIIAHILDHFATSAPMDMFMESHGERHPTELAGLRGHRLVTATETEDGRRWAESKLKAMTGGDRINARFMRKDPFVFTPQFKIVICGNHKPALRSIGPAMRRRLFMIPFTVTIPEEERDPNLKAKLLEEASGILQWAIEGAQEWHGEGLRPPAAVREATDDYFSEEDIVGLWLAENCVQDAAAQESASALYENYKFWSEARGERPRSGKWLSKSLSERRFARWRDAQRRGFYGLAIKSASSHFDSKAN